MDLPVIIILMTTANSPMTKISSFPSNPEDGVLKLTWLIQLKNVHLIPFNKQVHQKKQSKNKVKSSQEFTLI